ncbi:hypothetical protein BAUCODRAFT_52192, partial [Baudoinia panamericana UAMH 10762]
STLYNLEPQPTAKVILKTTSGDILLELFAKQTPLASRNFLQHCLDGYYDNTIFHRLVPGFIIQGGDPTGTGSGGISALNDGAGFGDEFHSRLKFNRRGLLGMAKDVGGAGGGSDAYGSQFFLTLDKTPELQGVCTMFGRVEGETIFNLVKMAVSELVEGSERPLYPTKVTGTEVLINPFQDMVARVKQAPRVREEAAGGKVEGKKRKKPVGKNVLSFGGQEGEDGLEAPVVKRVKANPKMVSVGQETPEKMNNTKLPAAPDRESNQRRRDEEVPFMPGVDEEAQAKASSRKAPPERLMDDDDEDENEDVEEQPNTKTLDRTNAEIAALKVSMKRTVNAAPKEKERPKNAFEAMIPSTSTRGRKRGKLADEKGAIDLFKAFKQRLEELPPDEATSKATNGTHGSAREGTATNGHSAAPTTTTESMDEEAELCDLHFIANCQSCKSWETEKPDGEAEEDGDDDPGWMSHALSFAKDTLGKDLEWKRKMEEIEVIDPLERARGFKEE